MLIAIRESVIDSICNSNSLGDEFHYIFECSKFSAERKRYIPRQNLRPNTYNLQHIFQSDDKDVLLKLAIFVGKIMCLFT